MVSDSLKYECSFLTRQTQYLPLNHMALFLLFLLTLETVVRPKKKKKNQGAYLDGLLHTV